KRRSAQCRLEVERHRRSESEARQYLARARSGRRKKGEGKVKSSLPEYLKDASRDHPIRREVTIEPKVLDEKNGIVRFTASDETMDHSAEVVRLSGWRFSYFQKNAPFVNSHDYSDVRNLLGQVVAYQIDGGALVEDVKFALTP